MLHTALNFTGRVPKTGGNLLHQPLHEGPLGDPPDAQAHECQITSRRALGKLETKILSVEHSLKSHLSHLFFFQKVFFIHGGPLRVISLNSELFSLKILAFKGLKNPHSFIYCH